MKLNETKMGRVKFGLPKAENVEGSLLRHVTALVWQTHIFF